MARQPLVVFANRPRSAPRRRTGRMGRWFRRKTTRAANAATNPDALLRGVAVIHGGVILLGDVVSHAAQATDVKTGVQYVANDMKHMPVGNYFKAGMPSIAAEASIGTRKLVKRGLNKVFGFMR